jgi:hypothetical protein
MQRLLLGLVATMSVAAITMSSHAAYADIVREMQAQRAPSAEILKAHATVHATMEAALDQPTVPVFIVASARSTR